MSTSAKKRKLEAESGSESGSARGSSLSSEVEGEAVDKFVRVTDQATGRTRWTPLSSDGTLAFSSFEHTFPGAYGLKYPTPNSNVKRGVPFNDNKKAFEAPFDGWKGKLFEVIYRRKPPVVSVAPG
ncbi:unnamed protein product [Meloidogyne enterolobii]|uniref:Uncharacterized protein n=1 Tax=Meloidogyne enterolobii TaxID=390850 RepID=A0ACB0ZAW8_MELEN